MTGVPNGGASFFTPPAMGGFRDLPRMAHWNSLTCPGCGDRQGHDHRPGEVGGEGIGGNSQKEALIKAHSEYLSTLETLTSTLSDRGFSGKKMTRGGQGSKPSTRPPGAQIDESGSTPREDTCIIGQSVHVAEIPGFRTSKSRPSHQSNKCLKTGPKTRRPAGLAAGTDRPRWLGRFCGWAAGGAWPEQNRRWMEREWGRRARRELPSTPQTNKRKPGQAPAGPASAGPAGRTQARAKPGSEWECHVEIEWIDTQLRTRNLGGLSAGRGGAAAEQQDSRGGVKRKRGVG